MEQSKYRDWVMKEAYDRVAHLVANAVIPEQKAAFWESIILAALDEGKRYGEQHAKD